MEKTLKANFLNILKGTLIGVLVSVSLIIVFAITLKFVDMSDTVIKIINQVIKVLSIFFGCFIIFRQDSSRALIKGSVLGLMYSLIAFVVFSILSGTFTFGLSNILDLLFGCVFGAICGVFCANLPFAHRLN